MMVNDPCISLEKHKRQIAAKNSYILGPNPNLNTKYFDPNSHLWMWMVYLIQLINIYTQFQFKKYITKTATKPSKWSQH